MLSSDRENTHLVSDGLINILPPIWSANTMYCFLQTVVLANYIVIDRKLISQNYRASMHSASNTQTALKTTVLDCANILT